MIINYKGHISLYNPYIFILLPEMGLRNNYPTNTTSVEVTVICPIFGAFVESSSQNWWMHEQVRSEFPSFEVGVDDVCFGERVLAFHST